MVLLMSRTSVHLKSSYGVLGSAASPEFRGIGRHRCGLRSGLLEKRHTGPANHFPSPVPFRWTIPATYSRLAARGAATERPGGGSRPFLRKFCMAVSRGNVADGPSPVGARVPRESIRSAWVSGSGGMWSRSPRKVLFLMIPDRGKTRKV